MSVDLDAIRREHRQRLFDRYEKESAAFSRLFTALLLFSVFFLAFALAPYAILQRHRQVIGREIAASSGKLEERRREAEQRRSDLAALQAQVDQKQQTLDTLGREVEKNEANARALAATVASNQSRIRDNAAERARVSAALTALREAQQRIDVTRADPEANVRDLRDYIAELQREHDRRALRPTPACPQSEQLALVSCLVRERVRTRIAELFQPLEESVVPAIARVDAAAATDLQQRLTALRGELQRRPLENPDFWRTVDEKYLFFGGIDEEFRRLVHELRPVAARALDTMKARSDALAQELGALQQQSAAMSRQREAARATQAKLVDDRARLQDDIREVSDARATAEGERKRLEAEVARLHADKKRLESDQTASQARQSEIEKRLSSIQSPFGTLPIGLREGILSFPFVLAVAYLVSAGNLAESMRLRGTCHRLYRQWDQLGQVVTDGQLSLFAPLWIDPVLPARRQATAIGLLTVPVAIFVIALSLIVYVSSIAAAPPLRGGPAWTLYGLASVVAVGVLAVSVHRIRDAWRAYPRVAAAGAVDQ
jgi:septal ring factor EnvC (AmiA/AmiB activator)